MLLRVPIEDGSDEFVEVEADFEDQEESLRLASAHDRRARVSAFSLASAMDKVMPVLRTIVRRVRSTEHAPDEIAMELGLKVGGEQGFILTKGTAEATLTLTLTWHKPPTTHSGS
ncbi:CU044_2847 family protein [Plantactinospora sonchi]|uniref:CU044_2847 family protein n=1 Tax=Plantactinospora sonchi TaxID=1544735 RepID=A0ABU7S0G0_9ACTN